jgi:hypothetical protein
MERRARADAGLFCPSVTARVRHIGRFGWLTVGRTLLVAIAVLVAGVSSLKAQRPDSGISVSAASLERIRTALQTPQQPISADVAFLFDPSNEFRFGAAPSTPDGLQLGVLTCRPPAMAGDFVCASVPVGALVTRAAHSIAVAQHTRAEKAARQEVAKALAEFYKAQP